MAHNHRITLKEATELTRRYQDERESMSTPDYKDALPYCETFDKQAFDELIREPESVSVRCYFGMNENKEVRLIFVSVDDKNKDILPGEDEQADAGAGILENGTRCPPICPHDGPLNPKP